MRVVVILTGLWTCVWDTAVVAVAVVVAAKRWRCCCGWSSSQAVDTLLLELFVRLLASLGWAWQNWLAWDCLDKVDCVRLAVDVLSDCWSQTLA